MANKYEKLASSATATQEELWTAAQKNEECANLVARNPVAKAEDPTVRFAVQTHPNSS